MCSDGQQRINLKWGGKIPACLNKEKLQGIKEHLASHYFCSKGVTVLLGE